MNWLDFSNNECDISKMNGEIITSIDGMEKDSRQITFRCESGNSFTMYHWQNCCESVSVEDVCGDASDVIGGIVVSAEERTESGEIEYGSQTFTFYDIQTTKGSVNIRWNGESNGYYSESVDVVMNATKEKLERFS